MEDSTKPEEAQYTSHVYVWRGPLNLAVHLLPHALTYENLRLGTITRAVYDMMRSIEGALDESGCFVLTHYEASTCKMHVTMLPVGAAEVREQMDRELQDTGIQGLLRRIKETATEQTPPTRASFMYNTPSAMDSLSGVTIVHELGASLDALTDFLSVIR
jgi:hypothetical protein